MAIGSTLHTFTVQLSDIDRGVYDELALRVARHPSETAPYMLTRVLAYCLEYEEGITFSEGVAATDEPAVMVRDRTGALVAWIEVGAPDAARLHTGSMKAERVAVYTHRDADKVSAAWTGKRIHRAEEVLLHTFEPGFIERMAERIERRSTATLTRTEGRIYLEVNGSSGESDIFTRSPG